MDKKMTMTSSLVKILKAKKAEERAIENAEMKMLYSAYVVSGLEIEEAIQLLKDHGKAERNECCEKPTDNVNCKSSEDTRQGKKAREEKRHQSVDNEHSDKNQFSITGCSKPGNSVFL